MEIPAKPYDTCFLLMKNMNEGGSEEASEGGDFFYSELADDINYNTLSILRIRQYFDQIVN